ncbi:MAG: GGDEF domain-containing protein [Clostridia bacterium]|nr:GGDEF domain-containing protein [Clostridia bacterium]
MDKVKKDSSDEKSLKNKKNRILIISFRWFALASITAYALLACDDTAGCEYFFVFFSLALIYNILITAFVIKSRHKSKFNSKPIIYADTIIISLFTTQSGGIDSDMYILLFFILGYCGIYKEKVFTLKVGILSVASYTLFSLYMAGKSVDEINHWRLVIRDVYLVLATCGITMINNEVKKYGELHKKEFKLARTDKLTGLANRHYFDQKLVEEADYAVNSSKPLNILIFDLDNFKKFNDTYGHVWGDKLLTLFSDIIKQNIRKTDIPVRYGGEEFLILIRDLDAATAKSVGDRIRRQLEKQRIYVGDDDNRKKVTVSCGVAQFPTHSGNIKEAIDLADKALYFAKENGKNIVISYEDMIKSHGRIV